MKKTTTSAEIVMIACLLAPFVYLALIWNQLPAEIPGHYSGGRVDRYDPKEELGLVMGGITILLYVVFRFTPQFNPNNDLNTSLYQKIRWLIRLFWTAFLVWFWTISWRGIEPETLLNSMLVGIGLLLAGLGNLMNNIKPNFFVGIRTPWTLTSETNWRQTHHLAARVFVIGGLVMMATAWLVPASLKMLVLLAGPLLMAFVPVIFSYILFRQAGSTNPS